jgi:hypothetical protein
MKIVPLSFRQVCDYITKYHRHHKRPRGGKVFLGLRVNGEIVGVAVIGRPKARAYNPEEVAEITRTCTDGTDNANSKLYGACRQITKAMGYHKVITYTEEGESGASLRAAGFVKVATLEARPNWAESSKKLKHLRDPEGRGDVVRYRWEIEFTSCG